MRPQLNPFKLFRTHCSSDSSVSFHLYLTSVLSMVKSYNSIPYSMIQFLFPNILGYNVCKLQTSLTPHRLVQISLLTISCKLILLEMCLVCLVSLPFLSMQISHLLYNIVRCACSGTTSGSLFNNFLLSILKFARSITATHYTLYSL